MRIMLPDVREAPWVPTQPRRSLRNKRRAMVHSRSTRLVKAFLNRLFLNRLQEGDHGKRSRDL